MGHRLHILLPQTGTTDDRRCFGSFKSNVTRLQNVIKMVAPHQIGQNQGFTCLYYVRRRPRKAMRTDEQGNIVGRQNPPISHYRNLKWTGNTSTEQRHKSNFYHLSTYTVEESSESFKSHCQKNHG